jgi:serine/threonine-protein kinase
MTVDNLVVNLIDQYKVELLLAAKPYTDHYLAYDVDEDRSVTLDVLRVGNTPAGFAAQFVSRSRAIAQIRHPNILRIYSVGRTEAEQPYVAQTALDAAPLSERLEQLAARPGSVNTIYALKLVRQLADALILATRLDLFHYDLRPQNVLLKNVALPTDDVLVLTDLNVPFERKPWTGNTGVDDLAAYLSPEQRAGKEIDAGSHVYSLGVLAYHLLAATLPSGPTRGHEVVLRRITDGGSALERARPGLTPETYELVDRALRQDPRQRYDSIETFVLALEQALLAEELRVGAAGIPVSAPTRRSWTLLTLLVLVALGAVAALTAAWLGGNQPLATATPPAIVAGPLDTAAVTAPGSGDGSGGAYPAPTVPATATADAAGVVAPLLMASSTATSEPATAAATMTPSPSATPTATPSATTTPAPPTATAEPRVAVGLNAVFLRRGPGTNYVQISTLGQGEEAVVTARFGEGEATWFEILTADGRTGWLSAGVVEWIAAQSPETVPTAASIPPTPVPTNTPTPTVTPTVPATPTLPPPGPGGNGGSPPPQPTQPAVAPTRTVPPLPQP